MAILHHFGSLAHLPMSVSETFFHVILTTLRLLGIVLSRELASTDQTKVTVCYCWEGGTLMQLFDWDELQISRVLVGCSLFELEYPL